ncbi:olfactory receptor 14J1-like [Phaenicophaeus curvirostris]|uniref:olfactory receptor 14J1-like n=1 Tax=Phaenicophaeus curvirostris TaxID=33595 RepID=UPI0037F0CE23
METKTLAYQKNEAATRATRLLAERGYRHAAASFTSELSQQHFCSARASPRVYDGKDSSAHSLGAFTKNDLMGVTLNSTSNHLWMEFNTSRSDTAQGSQLTHTMFHTQRQQMSNSSSTTQFLLLAFADSRELQLLHFWLFLGIYLAALVGNGLITTTIAWDHHLHTPRYFFLLSLSLLDLGSISTTIPKATFNLLWNVHIISYSGYIFQVFFLFCFLGAEYLILMIMSYDRYVAVCNPLHYGTLLGRRACVHTAAAAWGAGFLHALLHSANTFSLPLCQDNAMEQFFCESPQILKLSCSNSCLQEAWLLSFSFFLLLGCFVLIVVSYVQIFRAVLRFPSEQGRHKAFSTCLPHLAVVSLLVSTAGFAYLKPPSTSSPSLDLVVAVLHSVVPPALNPLIYSLRNRQLKDAMRNLVPG